MVFYLWTNSQFPIYPYTKQKLHLQKPKAMENTLIQKEKKETSGWKIFLIVSIGFIIMIIGAMISILSAESKDHRFAEDPIGVFGGKTLLCIGIIIFSSTRI